MAMTVGRRVFGGPFGGISGMNAFGRTWAGLGLAVAVASGALAGSAAANDATAVTRPAGTTPFQGDPAALAQRGAALFVDEKLSTNDMSCASCHADFGAFSETFRQPYPHTVGMAKDMFKVDPVTAEQMVQLCMVAPMAAKPLAWDSEELAALTAHVEALRAEFETRPAQ